MKVLVIKLSALGDMVQATPAFEIIRQRHKNDHLVLLTAYDEFAKKLGIFDEIVHEERHRGLLFFKSALNVMRIRPDITYDLQGVDRIKLYLKFLSGKKHSLSNENHSQDRLKSLLAIEKFPELDLLKHKEFIDIPKQPYCLIIPCGSAKKKLWQGFEDLSKALLEKNILPVIIGGNDTIFGQVDGVLNLIGKTSWFQIITLAEHALFAIGNDTGPIFLASSGNCKTIAIHDPTNPKEFGGHKGSKHKIFDFNITVEELIKEILR